MATKRSEEATLVAETQTARKAPPAPKRVENHTARVLLLPAFPTQGYQSCVTLEGGLTTVPGEYWEILEASPASRTVQNWQRNHTIYDGDRTYTGPMITVYEPDQCGRPDGPSAPPSLRVYDPEVASAICLRLQDPNDLRRLREDLKEDRMGHWESTINTINSRISELTHSGV